MYTEEYWAGKLWDERKGAKPPKNVYVANSVTLATCVHGGESYCAYSHPFNEYRLLTREQARRIRCISGIEEAREELGIPKEEQININIIEPIVKTETKELVAAPIILVGIAFFALWYLLLGRK